MPTVYKLINPLNKQVYYIGYTEKQISERLIGHLYKPEQQTTLDLININLVPLIESIESGPHVNKSLETHYIKLFASQGCKLENIDGLVNYQDRKSLFELPNELINEIPINSSDRFRLAIELLTKELPLYTNVPIMIRIKNIIKWANDTTHHGNSPSITI